MITIGIDLGTTNSVAAHHDGAKIDVIPMSNGQSILPSVVSFVPDQQILVGAEAVKQISDNSQFTFRNVKRLMGQRFSDEVDMGPQVVEGKGGLIGLQGPDGEVYAPEYISSLILSELRDAASAWFNDDVRGAVVTVPANFTQPQIEATRKAAEMAGFSKVDILTEPEAAAIACGIDLDKYSKILVFDMGGGTFDVTVMETAKGFAKQLDTNGIACLGGMDFDEAIADYVVDNYAEERGLNLRARPFAMQAIKASSEEAKKALSRQDRTNVKRPFADWNEQNAPVHIDCEITRDQFEEMTMDLVQRALDKTNEVLADNDLNVKQIDYLVLVGGMTRVPMVRDAVIAYFNGKKPMPAVNPDIVVAQGAAIQAAINENRIRRKTGEGIIRQSFGIEVFGGKFLPVLSKGKPESTVERLPITSGKDDQSQMSLGIYQGNSTEARENTLLGEYIIPLEAMPKGEPSVEVEFSIGSDGNLRVTVDETVIMGEGAQT